MINQASTTHSVSPKSDIFKSDGLFCENITPLCTTKKKKKKKKEGAGIKRNPCTDQTNCACINKSSILLKLVIINNQFCLNNCQ